MNSLHPAFDWHEVTRLVLTSRALDDLEENELTPQGHVIYQFCARGHELGQALLSQLMGYPFDGVSAYYRSRAFLLGIGLTVEESLASGMGKALGVSRGRDVGVVTNLPRRDKCTVLPMAGDVGSQFTPAAGWAQAIQYRQHVLGETHLQGSIAIVFGGDGAVATNGFWSALTMATTLELPLLFVVEDNGYAISVKGPQQTPGSNIAANLASFQNLTIWDGSGTNPAETAALVKTAVDHVREGKGAGLLRLTVPRLAGHSSADNQAYKSKEVVDSEWTRDPVKAMRAYLVPTLYSEAEWQALVDEVNESVHAAATRMIASPEPDAQEATSFVFADSTRPQQVGGLIPEGIHLPPGSPQPHITDPRRINMVEAIRRTLDVELHTNPRSLIFGEDVGQKGGVHAATMGLQTAHGVQRVFDTSLSEEGIIGRAVGMALAGLSPVAEIQFRKYADPATEQLNNCGTIRWRTANRFAAPMVVRMPGGFGRKLGDPWHSVTSESVYAHAVGWQVVFPSNAEDMVGLLRYALRDNNPTIIFEHRALMDAAWARRPYPGDEYVIPFGQARLLSQGNDLTVVTWGAMAERCDQAVQELGESIDLLDLRTIIPWDKEAVLSSVRKTGKCLIVHEDISIAGFGAEIAAVIAQEAFTDLDAPLERIAMPSIPVPYSTLLMNAVIPSVAEIRQKMLRLLQF
ncbi:MAG: transketolase C-terminal domain-containing protein [Candidatus Promineifilaceae bacterium]